MKQFRRFVLVGAFFAVSAAPALADPILGNWQTHRNASAVIAKCGGAYCITLTSGEHSGKRIGRLSGGNGTYSGVVTDPANNREYSGSAKVKGSSMKLTGCALKVICQTQNWRKK